MTMYAQIKQIQNNAILTHSWEFHDYIKKTQNGIEIDGYELEGWELLGVEGNDIHYRGAPE